MGKFAIFSYFIFTAAKALMIRSFFIIAFFCVSAAPIYVMGQAVKHSTPRPSAKILPLLLQGQKQMEQNDIGGSLQSYTDAIKIAPQDPFAYMYRGLVYLTRLSEWNKAKGDFDQLLQHWKTFSDGYFYRGSCYLNMQNLSAASTDFHKAIALDSANVLAMYNLGVISILLKEYTAGEHILSIAIRRKPQMAMLYSRRADIRFRLRKMEEALTDYDKAVLLNKDDSTAYANRAQLKLNMGKFEDAIQDFTYLIETKGYQYERYYNRAVANECIKMYEASNKDLQTILSHDINEHRARGLLARNLANMKQPQLALKEYTTILRLNPQDVRAFANIFGEVNAVFLREKFINGATYRNRSNIRFLMNDTIGAYRDLEKAAALGDINAMAGINTFPQIQGQAFSPAKDFPAPFQFFSRSADNKASLSVSGIVHEIGFDSAYCEVYADNIQILRFSAALQYTDGKATINFYPHIKADLKQYKLQLGLKSLKKDTVVCVRDSLVCGDVYLISGQSNAVLGSLESVTESPFIRTFFLGSKDSFWWQATGHEALEANIGTMGLTMASKIVRQNQIPLCIINGGISGSILEQHYRNDTNPTDPMSWYGRMVWRVRMGDLAKAAKAMIWYQGESNDGGGYSEKFSKIYDAWKLDFPALKKVYVIQIRPSNCINVHNHSSLREQQRNFAQKFPDVEVLASAGLPTHDGCHFGNEGYITLGNQLYSLLARDFYGTKDTVGIASPNLRRAYWTTPEKKEIALVFTTNDSLVIGKDTSAGGKIRSLANDAFLLDGKPIKAASVRVEKSNTIVLSLNSAIAAQTIGYVPDRCYASAPEAPCQVYEGPWLTTRRGVGALTFHNVPIEATP